MKTIMRLEDVYGGGLEEVFGQLFVVGGGGWMRAGFKHQFFFFFLKSLS